MTEETTTEPQTPEVFADLLNLEDQYHNEGYLLGVADGSKSGRIEGRVFGLEKGFEKFLEMGRLNGKAAVWEARLPSEANKSNNVDSAKMSDTVVDKENVTVEPLKNGGDRLKKHILRLAALSDPDDLSTENDEDSVSEFDDRLKDAKAKATLIARLVGEDEANTSTVVGEAGEGSHLSGAQRKAALRVKRNDGGSKPTGEMEDFVGLPGTKS